MHLKDDFTNFTHLGVETDFQNSEWRFLLYYS